MNTPLNKTSRFRFWPAFWIICLTLFSLTAVGVWGCLHVSRDSAALRNSIINTAAGDCKKTIEVRLGSWTFGLARFALKFVSLCHLEPEAQDAIQAFTSVRGVEVGVYRWQRPIEARERAAWLSASDDAMSRRGWDRLAGVVTEHEMVAVYVPGATMRPTDFKVCVATLSGQDLVIASARSNLEPLLELAMRHVEKEGIHLGIAKK